jgi:TRAP-type C4-dicarboxylate transport system substrate-binding protein
MNEAFFQGLTPKEQQAILEASVEGKKVNDKAIKESEDYINKQMKAAGVTFIEIDEKPFREKVKDLPYQLENRGLWTKGLYDRMKVITLK